MKITLTLKKKTSTAIIENDVSIEDIMFASESLKDPRSDDEWCGNMIEEFANIMRSFKTVKCMGSDSLVHATFEGIIGLLVDVTKLNCEDINIHINEDYVCDVQYNSRAVIH